MTDERTLDWWEGDRLLEFRAARGRDAEEICGPIPRDTADLVERVRAHVPDPERRLPVVSTLRPRWEALALPEAARASVDRLDDPSTRVVIAGQQPALWGGPVMIAIKALATVRVAEALEAAGIPAVPLFWIASEDHDVRELWGGRIVPPRGPEVDLNPAFETGRRMLGVLEHEVAPAVRLTGLEPAFRVSPHEEAWSRRIAATLGERPAEEFQNLWVDLFGTRGLLPVRPEWLRERQLPWIEKEFDAPGEHAALVRRMIPRLEKHGLPVPIPEPADLPFFWVKEDGTRHRIHLDEEGGRVRVGERDAVPQPLAQLRDKLAADPTRVSPDALLRPLVQDALLEPAVTILGPTELAYQLELGEVYRARGVRRPLLLPRPRLRILSEDDAATLARLEIEPGELEPGDTPQAHVPSPEAHRRAVALEEAADPLVALVAGWAEEVSLDPPLRKRADRLVRRWRDDLRKLEDALDRGSGTDVEEDRRAVEGVLARTFPDGREGERTRSLLGFLLEFGESGLDAIHANVGPGDGRPRLLILPRETEVTADDR